MDVINAIDSMKALYAVSEVYISMHIFDLNTNEFETIKSNRFIDMWEAEYEDVQDKFNNVIKNITAEEYLEKMINFSQFDTLDERMADKSSISAIFEGKINGLCRAIFIEVDRNPDLSLHHVICAVECIDKDELV